MIISIKHGVVMKSEFSDGVKIFIDGFFAGVIVSVSAMVYLYLNLGLIPALGYLIVLYYGEALYIENIYNRRGPKRVMNNALANATGAIVSGLLCRYSFPGMVNRATEICLEKSSHGVKIIPVAMFTGLMFTIVIECLKRGKNIYAIILMMGTFLVGGEDYILNVFYYSMAGIRPRGNIILLLLVSSYTALATTGKSRKAIA